MMKIYISSDDNIIGFSGIKFLDGVKKCIKVQVDKRKKCRHSKVEGTYTRSLVNFQKTRLWKFSRCLSTTCKIIHFLYFSRGRGLQIQLCTSSPPIFRRYNACTPPFWRHFANYTLSRLDSDIFWERSNETMRKWFNFQGEILVIFRLSCLSAMENTCMKKDLEFEDDVTVL